MHMFHTTLIMTTAIFNRLIFFGAFNSLHKMNIDGSGHVVIASGGIQWLHGVALDRMNHRVCWSNPGT